MIIDRSPASPSRRRTLLAASLAALVAGGVDPATANPTDGSGFPVTPITLTSFTIQ